MRLFWYLAVSCTVVMWTDYALAQRSPIADDTLGEERSIVTPLNPDLAIDRIDGGAERGDNLFHSFQEFHVDEGRGVYFDDRGFANIISRVTGGVASDILGVLGVIGDANLFLINPSGIVFGPGARLDVSGSFVATTADSFVFENGFAFSATDPQAPPLLTVSVPIGLQYGTQTPGAISVNQGYLTVNSGQSLILAGGDITVNNGGLAVNYPQGGRIELGAVSGAGTVGLERNGSILSLSFPETLARADVQITNGSVLDTLAEDGGSIAINAQSLDVLGGSIIQGGIGEGRGTANSQSGDIVLDATGLIRIVDSVIANLVLLDAMGNSGNIRVRTGSLSLTEGGQLATSTLGQGNAGDVIVEAQNTISFDGAGINGVSAAGSSVGVLDFEAEAIGNAGNILINTGSLSLSDGAQLQSLTLGRGDAGDVIINARDTVSFDGAESNGIASGVFSSVGAINSNALAVGNGGDIRITTGSLSLTNGAVLQASTFGQGDAGDVIIEAQDTVSFDGFGSNGTSTLALSTVGSGSPQTTAVGNGGDIRITTGSLSLTNGAQLITSTLGRGDAGNVIIEARNTVSIEGIGSNGVSSGILSSVGIINSQATAVGEGGDIRIATDSLSLTNGARLQTNTFGQGNAGDVIIDARDQVSFDNAGALSSVGAINFGRVAVGNGGNIHITTNSLSLSNNGQLTASTLGRGNAGDVIIDARDRVSFDNASVLSNVGAANSDFVAIGEGGDVRINTGSLLLTNGAQLSSGTRGQGNAGNVIINVRDRVSIDGTSSNGVFSGVLSSVGVFDLGTVAVGDGGDIRITADSLLLTNGARLVADTYGWGDAGDVIINARDRVSFDNAEASSAVRRINSNAVAVGNGGDIRITTGSLSLNNNSFLRTLTLGQGNAGNVIINARDRVSFDNAGALSNVVGDFNLDTGAVREGGNIRIRAGSLSLTDGSILAASILGRGNAGDVIINARDRISISEGGIASSVGEINFDGVAVGEGGDIRVTTGSLEVTDGAQLQAFTLGQGNAGNVIINARDTVSLDGVGGTGLSSGLFTSTTATATGQGGEITVDADTVRLADGAVINAQTFNTFGGGDVILNADTFEVTGGGQVITTTNDSGRAGNITLNVTDRITLSGFDPNYADRLNNPFGEAIISNQGETSGLFANTADNSSGQGGTIRITTGELDVSDRARIVANSQGRGVAGDIDISAQSVQLDRGRLTAETNARADGGNITLRDTDLLLLRNGSNISTTAGTNETADSGGNGGNITLDADFIVAFPNENSDIRANAYEGSGGNIDITTEGLFGIEAREQLTEFSDITASSELGVQGEININTPDVDPSRGLTELPEDVVDASDQIAQTCPTDGNVEELGEFVVTGRGGVPANPAELLGGETVLTELAEVEGEGDEEDGGEGEMKGETDRSDDRPATVDTNQTEIVEAQGWVVGADGKVILTAENPAVEPHSSPIAPVPCPAS